MKLYFSIMEPNLTHTFIYVMWEPYCRVKAGSSFWFFYSRLVRLIIMVTNQPLFSLNQGFSFLTNVYVFIFFSWGNSFVSVFLMLQSKPGKITKSSFTHPNKELVLFGNQEKLLPSLTGKTILPFCFLQHHFLGTVIFVHVAFDFLQEKKVIVVLKFPNNKNCFKDQVHFWCTTTWMRSVFFSGSLCACKL